MSPRPTRRRVICMGAGLPVMLGLVRPALATPEDMQAAIDAFTGGVAPQDGRVTLDIPLLVENGNAVPMTVSAESPMTDADHVTEIAVFNEANPLPQVVTFHFTPASGRAQASTRIRLSGSQTLRAIARTSDGGLWQAATDVIVTAPACAES